MDSTGGGFRGGLSGSAIRAPRLELNSARTMLSDRSLQRDPIERWSVCIRDHPLTALALGATAGFAAGGGMRTRIGSAILALAARTVTREVIMTFIAEATADYERAGRDSQDQQRA